MSSEVSRSKAERLIFNGNQWMLESLGHCTHTLYIYILYKKKVIWPYLRAERLRRLLMTACEALPLHAFFIVLQQKGHGDAGLGPQKSCSWTDEN